jgi:HK97 family phage prohead protease
MTSIREMRAEAANAKPDSIPCGSARSQPFRSELRASLVDLNGQSFYKIEGYASVVERGYEMWDMFGPYTEVVSEGAGSASLARGDLDVPLVLGHDQLRRLARTTTGTLILTEDGTGLSVHAPKLDASDYDVAYIAPKLRSGLIDEMSFAFRIESGQWSPDYSEYRINRYDIHRGDVAIVGYGANPHTAGATLRQPADQTSSRARALLELSIAR